MSDELETNRQLWDAWTSPHEVSEFYDLAGFRAGKISLRPIERAELCITASFVCADVARLPELLGGQFEIVFSSYGLLP